MKLNPSLKQRKRYVVFQVLSSKEFLEVEVVSAFNNAMFEFLGTLGMGQSSPEIITKTFSKEHQTIVIKVNHTFVDELKSALMFCTEIKGLPVIVRSIIVSGTLKTAKESLSTPRV